MNKFAVSGHTKFSPDRSHPNTVVVPVYPVLVFIPIFHWKSEILVTFICFCKELIVISYQNERDIDSFSLDSIQVFHCKFLQVLGCRFQFYLYISLHLLINLLLSLLRGRMVLPLIMRKFSKILSKIIVTFNFQSLVSNTFFTRPKLPTNFW